VTNPFPNEFEERGEDCFVEALESEISRMKLKTFPLEWEVLIYNRIDICKETAKNLQGNIFVQNKILINFLAISGISEHFSCLKKMKTK
jgi:hypothetical protein